MNQEIPRPLTAYEHVAQLTRDMLAAAREQDWDRLIALENACKSAFSELVDAPSATVLPAEAVRHKAALIRQILADDAAIRDIVQPWVAELGQWLGNANRAGKLRDAYATGHQST